MLLGLVVPLMMLLAFMLLPLSTRSAGSVPGPADRLPALLLLLMLLLLVGVVALVDHADGVHVVRGVVDRLAQLLWKGNTDCQTRDVTVNAISDHLFHT